MIDQRFIDLKAQELVEEPDSQEMQLASANTGVTTDGGAFVGYRLNMPKGLNTRENQAKQSVLIADTMAGAGKGMIQAFPGLPGDLESIGRMALGYLGYNVDENTVLPTSEEIGKRLESVLGPVIPPNQTTGVPTAERERAAGGGELGGEILSPGGQIALASKVAKPVIGATKKIIETGKDLPVGMSIKGVDESLDPLGFYSAASKAVDNIAQEKGTGQQFLAQIEKTPGVKKEELLWTGLDEFLKGKKAVTKAEIQEYLSRNRVEIEENRLDVMGGQTADDFGFNRRNAEVIDDIDYIDSRAEDIFSDLRSDAKYVDSIRNEVLDDLGFTDEVLDDAMLARVDETVDSRLDDLAQKQASEEYYDNPYYRYREDNGYEIVGNDDVGYSIMSPNGRNIDRGHGVYNLDEAEELARQDALEQGYLRYEDEGAKFADYTLPGGDNYRELLIRMPNKSGRDFTSSHFDEENILAHLRVNDRVIDGKKTLFVEEVQSDWHQAGRKKGYQGGGLTSSEQVEYDALQKEADALMQRKDLIIKNLPPEKMNRMRELSDKKAMETKGVPDAPFKTTWHELAMKRAIQLASEGKYDRIAFTTGAQQADRYNLAKQVDSIDWNPYESRGANKLVTIVPKNGNRIELPIDENGKVIQSMGGQFAGKSIDEIIGKDIAKKIMDGPSGDLSGEGLSIGGEGMKGFYDNILPKFLDKYGKKWDAKVGMTDMQAGRNQESVHYMDITPKMRESVLTKGQPLFQMAPAIPAGAAGTQMQEENK
jgi:ribosomal protein L14E/L6E/L27E